MNVPCSVKDLGRVVIEERVGLVVLDSMASILRRVSSTSWAAFAHGVGE